MMNLRELLRRVAGDDYKFDGSDDAINAMAAEFQDEDVWYIVVATKRADGSPHGIIRLLPIPLTPEERARK